MPEMMEEVQEFESNTIGIYRTAATVKGGRRFSFSALVVVGDRHGRVGIGYGKANQVPNAIEKGQKDARRKAKRFPMQGHTIPHMVTGRFGACTVRLIPASPGSGVIAGGAVRAVLEMMGIHDCLTKSFGSNNPKNLVKATLDGLSRLQPKEMIEELRGFSLEKTTVEESIERGAAFMPAAGSGEKAVAPVNVVGQDKKGDKGGRGRGRGGGGGRGRGGGGGGRPAGSAPAQTAPAPAEQSQPASAPAAAPAPETPAPAAPAPAPPPPAEAPKSDSPTES